jgi:hypothetical protein
MRNKILCLSVLFLSLTIILLALPSLTGSQTAQKTAPEEEGTVSDFQKAHEFFLKKDLKAAASEIRKGAEVLKKEVGNATEEGKKVLTASIQELEKLANDVEKGTVKSEKKLKDAFARADHALAQHHYLKASESWVKKETKNTGNALKNAAQHLEQAAKWSGRKLEAGSSEVVKGAREVADKLIKGTKWVAEEVSKGIKDIGNEISKIGEKIKPAKK